MHRNQEEVFANRHIGPNEAEIKIMLQSLGLKSLDDLMGKVIPDDIRLKKGIELPDPVSEADYLIKIKDISLGNKIRRTFIGQGYYGTFTPSVIQRNIFENPGWYTSYTPYQAEISQGRLESLLNFQTMVSDLCALPLANASLLDEATAAAEAMAMFFHSVNKRKIKRPRFFADQALFPQTIEVLRTRAIPKGIELVIGDFRSVDFSEAFFGAIVQYPNNIGAIEEYAAFIEKVHSKKAYAGMATDLLALTLLKAPGELGADAAFGSSQRFGVPIGFGGPHAAFFAATEEFKRLLPGRIIGVSEGAEGELAYRMALQTREQHIKREKATSNICTAQALLANMAAMYAVYHGPEGLKAIAQKIHLQTSGIRSALAGNGIKILNNTFFDTLTIKDLSKTKILRRAEDRGLLFRNLPEKDLFSLSLDEITNRRDLKDIVEVITGKNFAYSQTDAKEMPAGIPDNLQRASSYLTHPVFNSHHSETKMMRYIHRLENKDLSLNTSMISLGSCTMKLNAATEMIPLSWAHWSKIHPFAPAGYVKGYLQMVGELETFLCKITGMAGCSLQPNSGAAGEFAGLMTIRNYQKSTGQGHRNIMLIPISAHGTNPASATMAGCEVVVIKTLQNGDIDVDDLEEKAKENAQSLCGIMITYPSTYGIFESKIRKIIRIVHQYGGQVYLDGANMNAQITFTSPGEIGADACHLNLHKTFAIPHGGGGPGVGPICAAEHLKPFLPGDPAEANKGGSTGAVSASSYGSASILLISYAYIRLLGPSGLSNATACAILNANYLKKQLEKDFSIVFTGDTGFCAHEFIIDLRPFRETAGITVEDVAKRLMDYGFHAPTMSFPVPGTFMIEPTESEDKAELDRFCDAMRSIREEIREIEEGKADRNNNVLKNAPHTQQVVISDNWDKPYAREKAAFPLPYVRENKFWPAVSRIDNTLGDRNLICTCVPTEQYL